MKKCLLGVSLLLAGLFLFSCKEKEGPDKPVDPKETIKSLAELLAKSTSSSAEFDFSVSNLVVTAVYENYAQLEDGTCGAQLNKSNHGLKVGQKIDGRITGKARNTSGALILSELNIGAATVSSASSLPELKISLAEVLADKGKYTNRRVKLVNVTFVNGFNGSAGGAGTFSQKGVQIAATCRPAGIIIPDGWQGDLVCFPSAAACYIFSADDFSEHAIDTPLAKISTVGVYSSAETKPSAKLAYRPGVDQYAFAKNNDEREFRIQNYDEEWVLKLRFPVKYKLGQELQLTTNVIGVKGITEGESKVFVEKLDGGMIWLMDYESDLGYVLYLVEE